MILDSNIVFHEEAKESSTFYRMLKTWAEIDLATLRHNIKTVKQMLSPDIRIMAVVKCNAYGHGVLEVTRELLRQDIEALGVSSLFEGIELRRKFRDIPIVALSAGMSGQAEEFLEYNLAPIVCSWEMVHPLAEAAIKRATQAKVHVKIDTGMGRIGVWHEHADEFIRSLYKTPGIIIEGICSHFATADEEDLSFAKKQLEWFNRLLEKISDLPIKYKHISNTGAIFNLPSSYHNMNMVRPGASLYGIPPSRYIRGSSALKPVLTLKAKIAFIKKIPPGRTLSYGRTFRTKKDMVVATLPVGYGDGIPRYLSNKGHVLIKGQRAPILGTVTMDQIMVDITHLRDVHTEDVAVLIGKQGQEEISAFEIAQIGQTTPYEIFTSINKRVQRIFLNQR